MKTLVIHPDDRSTDFLKEIYKGKDWTIINDHTACKSRKVITQLIKKHDRIVMMGHGYPGGLFFTCINPQMVYLLRQKECVCIWCNADQFVRRYSLTGFFTGMFISEVGEANHYRITTTQKQIDYSNNLFATELNKVIDDPNVCYLIKEAYKGDDPVIQFNNSRLYYQDEESILAARELEDEMKEADLNRNTDDDGHYLLIY